MNIPDGELDWVAVGCVARGEYMRRNDAEAEGVRYRELTDAEAESIDEQEMMRYENPLH